MLARFIPHGFGTNLSMLNLLNHVIHHVIDIEKLLGVDNLDEFINNTSL